MSSSITKKNKVFIVGGGFAGMFAVKKLAKRKDLEIVLIDKRNFHLFQPLLYQVATGSLSPGDIAAPIRSVFRKYKNVTVLSSKVASIDVQTKSLFFTEGDSREYDFLILATGVTHDYFGNSEWEVHAPGLKTVEDSLEMRRKILTSFELAERETNLEKRLELLTFVVVGGGPTGVELAGAIGDLAKKTLAGEFRNLSLSEVRIIILEGGERLLSSFPEKLSDSAKTKLEKLGVEVKLRSFASEISKSGVSYSSNDQTQSIKARTVLWAAGVKASELGSLLSVQTGVKLDRVGRVKVSPDLSIPDFPEIMVAGDLVSLVDAAGVLVPGVAPAAMQQGAYVANRVSAIVDGKSVSPFRYKDKGSLAVIGRNAAVAKIGKIETSGFFAWLLWALVHIYFLVDFGNKLLVATHWVWSYITKKKGARLITSGFKTRIER